MQRHAGQPPHVAGRDRARCHGGRLHRQDGSKVEDATRLTRCFVGQACELGHGYSASDSLFFCNCQEENGEACAVFAGPFTVTHHKSTLLIAGMFSFMNAGSGSNQSNHMYKLGPIHQGAMERGSKTSSDSYVLWPARIGAFSLVMGRHTTHPDTSSLPFSYLIESKGVTYLVPGVNLRSVGTIRDVQKWPKRDRRPEEGRLDKVNFNLLSPYTIDKMVRGIGILENLRALSGATSDSYAYQSARITNSALEKGIGFYRLAIDKFLGNSLISRLEKFEGTISPVSSPKAASASATGSTSPGSSRRIRPSPRSSTTSNRVRSPRARILTRDSRSCRRSTTITSGRGPMTSCSSTTG